MSPLSLIPLFFAAALVALALSEPPDEVSPQFPDTAGKPAR